jgi:tetratricopeptide (TPR) repeat protein
MSDHTTQKTPSRTERIQAFLSTYKVTLSILSVVLIVGILASVGISQWLNSQAERSAEAAEEIQNLWDDFQDNEDAETETELREAIETALETHPRRYASLRALLVLGQLEYQKENYEAALEAFRQLAETHDGTYIEPTALAGAAAAAEESGDAALARDFYGRIVEIEGVPNLERPRALFSLGRLAEAEGDTSLAVEYYQRLVDEHGSSNWTNLGRNRIIWLTSRGSASEG